MIISIKELLHKENYYFSNEIQYWFDKDRCEWYTNEQIKEFGYSENTRDDLVTMLSENNIIPSFTANDYEFDKMFINSFKNKKLLEQFSKITDEQEYDHAFRVYTENNNIFYGKEYFEFRKNAAVKWCIKNNIKYRQDAVWQDKINGNDFWRIK